MHDSEISTAWTRSFLRKLLVRLCGISFAVSVPLFFLKDKKPFIIALVMAFVFMLIVVDTDSRQKPMVVDNDL